MEAVCQIRRCMRGATLCASVSLALVILSPAWGANARSRNFLVTAPTQQLAQSVAQAAEKYRDDLAVHWLGQPLPPWPTPCPIEVVAGPRLAAQGVTTYNRAPVRDFQMKVIGTPERILDSVLPHEVTHTILATHFGRPLPRWADEGICTTVEHDAERNKHEMKLREFLQTRRGIAMNRMFLLTEYPNDVLPLYAQGYSVCRFLIEQKGPRSFIAFLEDYMQHPSWTKNVQLHYGYESLLHLQQKWLSWVSAGSGPVGKFVAAPVPDATPASTGDILLASAATGATAAGGNPVAQRSGAQRSGAQRSGAQPAGQPGKQPMVEFVPAGTPTLASAQLARRDSHGASDADQRDTGGWYHRRRADAARGGRSTAPPADYRGFPLAQDPLRPAQPAAGSMAQVAGQPNTRSAAGSQAIPPSVRGSGRYSVSQPQPEESISSAAGTPLYGARPVSEPSASRRY